LKGWSGRYLDVDLSAKKIVLGNLPLRFLRSYIGSRGLASRLLFEWLPRGIDPLGKQNILIFSVGPFTGTIWSTGSRWTASAKSPLTGGLGYANSAGHFGAELSHADYDMIVFRGASEKPTYLWIKDDHAELRDAEKVWGLDTHKTEDILRAEVGDSEAKVACIGPAGERLVRIAAIINDKYRAAARCGIGAVMGSKKLKAVIVRGTKRKGPGSKERIHDSKGFMSLAVQVNKRTATGPETEGFREYGTPALIMSKNAAGDNPSRNFQTGQVPFADAISGETIREKYLVGHRACFACPVHCTLYTKIENGPYAGTEGEGPEYETISSFGTMLWNGDFGSIAHSNYLCNTLGLDTISTGGVIAFAMECYQRGILRQEQTGGLKLEWGDPETIIRLVKMIAYREGIGRILGEGVKRAAESIGNGAEQFAMHVKGMEIPRQEPRTVKAFALGHATSNRGADHLYALPTIGYGNYKVAKRYFPHLSEEDLRRFMDIRSEDFKALQVSFTEKVCAIADSLGVCKFTTAETYAIIPEQLAEGLSKVTGEEYTLESLLEAGERIINIERLFNLREGFGRADDALPQRFLKEPYAAPGYKPTVVDLSRMLNEYYDLRGWDRETGSPKPSTIERLGLNLDGLPEDMRPIAVRPVEAAALSQFKA